MVIGNAKTMPHTKKYEELILTLIDLVYGFYLTEMLFIDSHNFICILLVYTNIQIYQMLDLGTKLCLFRSQSISSYSAKATVTLNLSISQ